jgi:hypothetical protein
MQNHDVQNKPGADLSFDEIEACVAVLKEGCAVNIKTAEHELPQSVMVGVARIGEKIVGVGAIKRERPNYASRIVSAVRSGFPFDLKMNELGYVAVLKTNQGCHLSGKIVDSLLRTFEGSLWATTFNTRMKSTLSKRGFEKQGSEWLSGNGKDLLSLWIRKPK